MNKTSIVCIILTFIFSSCIKSDISNTGKSSDSDSIILTQPTYRSERLNYPIKLHYIERCNMKYMISSGMYGESGTDIRNLTLDSLKVEYYKRQLELK